MAAWPWLAKASSASTHGATGGGALGSAFLRLAVGLGVAALLYFVWHRSILSAIVMGVSLVFFAIHALAPATAGRALDRFFGRFGALVGRLLAYVTLVPLYLLFFAPFHLLFRRGSRDQLRRKLDREAASYWTARSASSRTLDYYRRQH